MSNYIFDPYSYLLEQEETKQEAQSEPEVISEKAMGAHHKSGKDWYVDSGFVNAASRSWKGSELRHLGFGEFYLVTPDGHEIQFARVSGKKFPGMTGRSHKMYDDNNGKSAAELIKKVEQAGLSTLVEDATGRYREVLRRLRSGKDLGKVTVTKGFETSDGQSIPKGDFMLTVVKGSLGASNYVLTSKADDKNYVMPQEEFQGHFKQGHIKK
jgi:hypothetical protein